MNPGFLSAQSLTWQAVLPDNNVRTLSVVGDYFVAGNSSNNFHVSTDGIDWIAIDEPRADNAEVAIGASGVLIQEALDATTNEVQLQLRFSSDFETFDTVYTAAATTGAQWLFPPRAFHGAFVASYFDGTDSFLISSSDGLEWSTVLSVEGKKLGVFGLSNRETLLLNKIGGTSGHWAESTDGLTWEVHHELDGHYASARDAWIGVSWDGNVYRSTDTKVWTKIPFDLRAPLPIAGNGERVVIVSLISYESRSTTDGISFASGTIPYDQSNRTSGSTGLTVHDGIFWLAYVPFGENGVAQYFYSSDGITWTASDTPPPSDTSTTGLAFNSYSHAPKLIDEDAWEPISTSLTVDDLTVAIEKQDDELYQLVERHGGNFRFVGTDWIPSHGSSDNPQPRRLVEKDGIFLCLTTRNNLGRLDPQTTYLEQAGFDVNSLTGTENIDAIDGIFLEWTSLEGVDFYRLYRRAEGASPESAVLVAETASSQAYDASPELERGRSHRYFLTTHRNDGTASLPGPSHTGYLRNTFDELHYDVVLPDFVIGAPLPSPTWVTLPWWERVYKPEFPWVYSVEHGWWYLREVRWGFWTYDQTLGWFWSHRTLYPHIYLPGRGWRYYLRGTTGPRWFYDYTVGDWVTDADK